MLPTRDDIGQPTDDIQHRARKAQSQGNDEWMQDARQRGWVELPDVEWCTAYMRRVLMMVHYWGAKHVRLTAYDIDAAGNELHAALKGE